MQLLKKKQLLDWVKNEQNGKAMLKKPSRKYTMLMCCFCNKKENTLIPNFNGKHCGSML